MSRDEKDKDRGTEGKELPKSDASAREDEKSAPAATETPRRGLRRRRPISVVPEASDVDHMAETRRRFFTRPMSGDSGVQSASGVRRRWRWFRPLSRAETRPPSDLSDTEARTEAARSAAAELRSHLKESEGAKRGPMRASARPAGALVSVPPSERPAGPPGSTTRSMPSPSPTPSSSAPASSPDGDARPEAYAARGAPRAPTPAKIPAPGEPAPVPDGLSFFAPLSPSGSPAAPAARPESGPLPSPTRQKREPVLRRLRRPLAELLRPTAWQRHDLLVVAVALVLFLAGAVAQRRLAAPSLSPMARFGLHLSRPSGWLPPRRVGRPPSGLAARADIRERGDDDPGPVDEDDAVAAGLPYHILIQSALDPTAGLEIRIAERPNSGDLRTALMLQRVSRHGEAHWAADSTERTIGGRDWFRTEYRYAYKGSKTDAPRIATGIEYATINGRLLYTVTVHGSGATVRRLEALLVPTLAVDANHPAAVGAR